MKIGFRIVGVLLSLVAAQAVAQSTVHDVYLDLDADPGTGCSVVTPAGTVAGVELRLRASVDGDPAQVQAVSRATCAGGTFGAGSAQPAGYPVGLNAGTGGADVVEFSTALAGLGDGDSAPATFVSSNAAGADLVQAVIVLPGGTEPPGATPQPTVIPATGWLALLLLIGFTVWLVRRHPGFGSTLVVIVMMGAGVAWAANFIADGQIVDWTGETPLATDPANDASDGSAEIDIVAVFAATEAGRLHLRVDVRDLEPADNQAPTLAPAAFTLDENSAAGTAVGTVTGTDADAGQTLAYAIVAGNTGNAFAIDAATGAITVANAAALDTETTPTFALTVTATDDGTPALSGNATVTITLADVNEAPSIDAQTFATAENAPNGTTVAAVVASDPDASAPNATLTFAITGGNTGNAFAIDAASGTISVANSAAVTLANAPFALTVSVTDGGTPALSDSATITIAVTDQNDAPSFAQPTYTFPLPENSAVGTPVGTLTATDPDAGQTLAYAIASGNVGNAFAIDATTGAITVADASALDFETTPSFTLTVSVTDSGTPALSDTATVTLTLSDANDAPLAADATFSVAENTAVGTVFGTYAATDPDATAPDNTLAYAISGGNDDGVFAIDSATGELRIADNTLLDFETTPSFALQVTATDGGTPALSDTATVTITLLDINEAPTLPAATRDVVEASPNGTPVGAPLAGIDPDTTAPNNTLTYAIVGGNTGGAFQIDAATGQISVANSAAVTSATPVFTLQIDVTDGGALSGSGTVTITVTDVNDAPSFTAGPDQTSLEDAGTLTGTPDPWATAIDDNDPTAQNLTFLVTAANPALFSTQPAISPTGTLTYTAAPDANGSTLVTVVLQDDGGTALGGADSSAPQTFNISVGAVNDAPLFTAGPNQSVLENAPAQTVPTWATGIAAGPANESGQTVAFAVTGNTDPALFSVQPAVAADGTLTYTPAAGVIGTATITLQLQDNGGTADGGVDTSAPQTFTISINNVNDAPTFTAGPPQTVNEDAGAQTVAAWATAIDDGDPAVTQALTFAVTNNTNAALFAVAPAVAPDGTLTYTPAADANGSATITLTLSDDGGTADGGVDTSAPQSFTIDVTAVNDVPAFVAGPPVSVLENAGPQSLAAWATGISAGPADESGQVLAFTVTGNSNAALFSAGPAIAPDGTLSFTPAANTVGSATITVQLADNGGTANGGVDTSAPQTFTIAVNNVNDAPSFVAGPPQTVNEDAGAQTVPGWATAIDDGDSAVTQALTFAVTNNTNAALFAVQPTVAPDGTLAYTPAANANGSATITVVLSDDGGTADGGVDTSAPQTFTITVTAVNDVPVFIPGAPVSVLENAGPQTIAWATGISAGPADEAGQVLAFAITGNTNAALFSAGPALAADGTLTFTPAANNSGSASITVQLADNGGTANGGVDTTAPLTFTITVIDINAAPSFVAGPSPTVNEDAGAQTLVGWATAIDDGDAAVTQALTFNVTGNSNAALFSAGPAVAANGTLTYAPAANANGSATITLVLSDDGGTANGGSDTSAPQSFTITVNAVNDAPVFTAGPAQTVDEDAAPQTITGWATGIGPGGGSDEAAQVLGFNIVSNSNPALFASAPTIAPNGTLSYIVAPNASGTATLSITLSDNGGTANGGVDTSAPQSLVITVNNVNDAPSFVAGANPTVLEDAGPQTINPWATAIDDGDPGVTQALTFQIVSNDNAALFSAGPAISAAGVLSFTPAADASGVATISVRLIDNGGTANGGVDASAPQVFTITVTEVNDAPTATAKNHATHSAIALSIVAASHTGELLEGAADPDDATGVLTAQLVAGSFLPAGAQVTLTDAAAGSFRYDPPGGYSGAGSFQFRICDDGLPVGPVQCSAPQTASINVTGPELWFVDDSAAAGGDGGLTDPFTSLAAIPGTRGNGDRIFVFSGNYASAHTLNASEQVIGQAATAPFGALLGVVTPGNGQLDALPAVDAAPSLVGGVTFGGNDGVLRGVLLGGTSGTAVSAGAVTGIVVSETSIDAATTAANFNGTGAGAGGVVFTSTRSTAGVNGLVLNNLTGTFNFGSGQLSGHSGTTLQAGGTLGATSFAGSIGKTVAGRLVDITAGASGTVALSGNLDCVAACGTGAGNGAVRVAGRSGGAVSFTGGNNQLSGSATNPALQFTGNTGATLTIGGATYITTTTGTGLDATGGGALSLNGIFDVTTAGGRAVRIDGMALSGSPTGTLFTNGALGLGNAAVDIRNSTAAGTFTLGQELLLDHDEVGESGGGVHLVNNTGTWAIPRWTRVSSSNTTALRASNAGTLSVGDVNPGRAISGLAPAIDVQNTTIGAQDLNFVDVSSFNSPTNGIVLNNTGTTGGLVVTGTGAAGTGGAITGAGGHGITLTNTTEPAFAYMQIENSGGDGINGTTTTGFSFINGSIDNSGTGGAVNASNIGFNETALGTERNLSGTVVITGNTFTNARYHGVDIYNFAGTLADVTISNNTLTSSTSAATSMGSAVRLVAYGSGGAVASVTRATLENNTVRNFPGGAGILAQGGNASLAGPAGTFGVAGSATNVIRIAGNSIAGQSAANRIGAEAIVALVQGNGSGNFEIVGNGSIANPITHVTGQAISHSAFGNAVVSSTISGNVIVANNTFASPGIGVGTSVVAGFANTASLTTTISGNNVSATDGNGILAVARDGSGTLRAKIQNNTVAAPLTGFRPGIRIDAGNGASTNDTVCLNIAGNSSAGSGGQPGIGLRKQGTVTGVNGFGVNGMAATATPAVETYVNGINPAGNGTLLLSAQSGFSSCNLP